MSDDLKGYGDDESITACERRGIFVRLGTVISPIAGVLMLWGETSRYILNESPTASISEIFLALVCVGVTAIGGLVAIGGLLGWITGVLGNRSSYGAILGIAISLGVCIVSIASSNTVRFPVRAFFAGIAYLGSVCGGVVIVHRCIATGWLRLQIEDYFVMVFLVAAYLLSMLR